MDTLDVISTDADCLDCYRFTTCVVGMLTNSGVWRA